MTAETLLAECTLRGIELSVAAGRLAVDAPAGVLTRELVAELRRHKAVLVALLADSGRGSPGRPDHPQEPADATTAAPAAPAGDPGDDPELAERVAKLTPDERALFDERLAARRAAGELEPGVGWRALIDVRIESGHWPRPRAAR